MGPGVICVFRHCPGCLSLTVLPTAGGGGGWSAGSLSVGPRAAAAASPGNLSEMQVVRPLPRPAVKVLPGDPDAPLWGNRWVRAFLVSLEEVPSARSPGAERAQLSPGDPSPAHTVGTHLICPGTGRRAPGSPLRRGGPGGSFWEGAEKARDGRGLGDRAWLSLCILKERLISLRGGGGGAPAPERAPPNGTPAQACWESEPGPERP